MEVCTDGRVKFSGVKVDVLARRWRDHQIPAHKRERGGMAKVHVGSLGHKQSKNTWPCARSDGDLIDSAGRSMAENLPLQSEWTDDDRDIRNFLGLMASVSWGAVTVTFLTVQQYNLWLLIGVGATAIMLTISFFSGVGSKRTLGTKRTATLQDSPRIRESILG
jgi:hypothetical protein